MKILNNFFKVSVLAFVLFMMVLFFSKQNSPKKIVLSRQNKEKSHKEPYRSDNIRTLIQKYKATPVEFSSTFEDKVSSDSLDPCILMRKSLTLKNSEELIEAITQEKFVFIDECFVSEHNALKALIEPLFNSCAKENFLEESGTCLNALFAYRIHYLYKTKVNINVEDLSFEELGIGIFNEIHFFENPDRLIKLSQRIRAMMPNSPAISKVSVIANLVAGIKTDKSLLEIFSENQESFDKAIELNPEDIELIDLDMLIATQNAEPDLVINLKKFSDVNPESGLGLYYLASHSWNKEKNRKKSIKLLEQALKREPKNSRFQQTLEIVKEQEVGAEAFMFNIFSTLDDLFKPDN